MSVLPFDSSCNTHLDCKGRSYDFRRLVRRIAIQVGNVATMRMTHLDETVGDLLKDDRMS